jgi:hypothetical protein
VTAKGPDLETIAAKSGPVRSSRFLGHWSVLLAVAVAGAGAVGYRLGTRHGEQAARPSPLPRAETTTSTAPGPVSHVSLGLGVGYPAAEWEFPAPDPKLYVFSVTADTRPAGAVVAFAVRVTGGRTLNLGSTTDPKTCEAAKERTRCRFNLGVLEAETAGTWVLRLEKKSSKAASIDTTVSFDHP